MLYKGLNNGRRQAVIIKVCVAGRRLLPGTEDDEILQQVLSGDLEIVVQKAKQVLFDRHGRRIPPRGLVAAVCDPHPNFRLNQPDLDYVARLARLQQAGLTVGMSADEFKARSEAILATVSGNEQVSNLLKGVYLPVVIPRMVITDLGEVTEKMVEAARASYRTQFPTQLFTNHCQGQLANQVSIVSGTRYENLITGMAQGDMVALYFPACLQGFSAYAQREQMQTLPAELILSGPLDAAIGWAMYPDILGRDFQTPGYNCSAVQWQSPAYALLFRANDGLANFGNSANLGYANVTYSGGLLRLG